MDITKREYIDNKYKGILEHKQRNLENIMEKLDDEHQRKCTFNPQIFSNKYESKQKRNINKFLDDQAFHLKKVEDKVNQVN